MAVPSEGAQHYVLMLIPNLLGEIERLGLRQTIAKSSLTEQELTSLYFEFKSIARLLPAEPAAIDPVVWPDLLEGLRLLSALVRESARDDLQRAKTRAINQFLPQARKSIQAEFDKRLRRGNVDFRLAGISRPPTSPARAEHTCFEAIRLERRRRYKTIQAMTTDGLDAHQAAVVRSAQRYIQQQMADPPEAFGSLDLLISLVDVLRLLLLLEPDDVVSDPAPPGRISVANVVMGMGNILYCDELGLKRIPDDQTAEARAGRQ